MKRIDNLSQNPLSNSIILPILKLFSVDNDDQIKIYLAAPRLMTETKAHFLNELLVLATTKS